MAAAKSTRRWFVVRTHAGRAGATHTFESFPNGWHQFISEAASSWATMALLFTLPDKR